MGWRNLPVCCELGRSLEQLDCFVQAAGIPCRSGAGLDELRSVAAFAFEQTLRTAELLLGCGVIADGGESFRELSK
jgi:hypothetical protein